MKGDVFEPDALVFAKVRGYPAWPAKVTAALDGSKKPKKYSVFFFGTYEVASVKVEDLFAYDEKHKAKFGAAGIKRKGFAEAMAEIEESPDLEVQLPLPAVTKTSATPRSAATSASSTPASTPKPRGRGRKRKEDDSTPSAPGGKRRRVDSEGGAEATPAPAAPTSAEPVLSRSGRQIKPKKFADDDAKKAKTPGSAAAKRAARAAAAAIAADAAPTPAEQKPSDMEADEEDEDPDHAEVGVSAEEPVVAQPVADDADDAEDVDGAEHLQADEGAGGDGPTAGATTNDEAQIDAPLPPAPPRPHRDMRYRQYPAHETEDIIRVVDSAHVQHNDDRKFMYVTAKCGEVVEIDITDRERPKEFKSEKARIMWDTATAINLRRLRYSIEQGHVFPDRLREKLLAKADLADDLRRQLKAEKKQEFRRSKLWWLRDEARLIELDYNIKMNLIINQQNHDKCADCWKEVIVMAMAPLMLKKNPDIVETARKCRKYTHSAEIRDLADQAYRRFKKMFQTPVGKMFREFFDEQVAIFRKLTEEMEEHKVIGLTRDPLFKRPGEADSEPESDDELWHADAATKAKMQYRHHGASNGESTGEESPAVARDGGATGADGATEQNVTIAAGGAPDAADDSMDVDAGVEDLGGKTIPAGEEDEHVPTTVPAPAEAAKDTPADADAHKETPADAAPAETSDSQTTTGETPETKESSAPTTEATVEEPTEPIAGDKEATAADTEAKEATEASTEVKKDTEEVTEPSTEAKEDTEEATEVSTEAAASTKDVDMETPAEAAEQDPAADRPVTVEEVPLSAANEATDGATAHEEPVVEEPAEETAPAEPAEDADAGQGPSDQLDLTIEEVPESETVSGDKPLTEQEAPPAEPVVEEAVEADVAMETEEAPPAAADQ